MCIMENVYWETIKLFEIEIEKYQPKTMKRNQWPRSDLTHAFNYLIPGKLTVFINTPNLTRGFDCLATSTE